MLEKILIKGGVKSWSLVSFGDGQFMLISRFVRIPNRFHGS